MKRARNGELLGLAVAAKPVSGPVEIAFTDFFRRNPTRAMGAAARMNVRANDLQDELEAGEDEAQRY